MTSRPRGYYPDPEDPTRARLNRGGDRWVTEHDGMAVKFAVLPLADTVATDAALRSMRTKTTWVPILVGLFFPLAAILIVVMSAIFNPGAVDTVSEIAVVVACGLAAGLLVALYLRWTWIRMANDYQECVDAYRRGTLSSAPYSTDEVSALTKKSHKNKLLFQVATIAIFVGVFLQLFF